MAQNSFRFMCKNSQKNHSGFAQIAQKKLRKTLFVSCAKIRKKIISGFAQFAKIAQILRKKYSHFVETLNIINQDNFILFLEDLKLEMSELIIEKSAKLDFTVFFKNVWFVVRIYKFSFNLFRENFIQPTKMLTKTQNVR